MMVILLLVFLVGVAASVPTAKEMKDTVAAKATTPNSQCDDYPCMIFEDDFNTFDFTKWEHELTAGGGGNWEFQYYTNNRSNSYVRDGRLFIRPTTTEDKYGEGFLSSGKLDLWGSQPYDLCTGNAWYGCERTGTAENYLNPVASARLRTVNSFNFAFGRIDIVARMPKGDWLWPALWMLPRYNEYGAWPTSGEIDIAEIRGNGDLQDPEGNPKGHQTAGQTMHWGPYWPQNAYWRTIGEQHSDYGDSLHTYTVIWDTDSMTYLIDDVETFRVAPPAGGFYELGEWDQELGAEANPWKYGSKMAPFDKGFYILMNVAVGGVGGYFNDSWTNAAYPKPWSNESPTAHRDFWNAADLWLPTWVGEAAAMEVDSVYVYKLEPGLGEPSTGVTSLPVSMATALTCLFILFLHN